MVIVQTAVDETLHRDVQRFVDAMVYKLHKNSHKGKWENLDIEDAIRLLKEEVVELQESVKTGNFVEMLLEAADIANFAMMVASIATMGEPVNGPANEIGYKPPDLSIALMDGLDIPTLEDLDDDDVPF